MAAAGQEAGTALVFMAKVANHAERYADAVQFARAAVGLPSASTPGECLVDSSQKTEESEDVVEALVLGYLHLVAHGLAPCRLAASMAARAAARSDSHRSNAAAREAVLAHAFSTRVRADERALCFEAAEFAASLLAHAGASTSARARVRLMQLEGYFLRFAAEHCDSSAERDETTVRSRAAYESALTEAEAVLGAADGLRLEIALRLASLIAELCNAPEQGVAVVEAALGAEALWRAGLSDSERNAMRASRRGAASTTDAHVHMLRDFLTQWRDGPDNANPQPATTQTVF